MNPKATNSLGTLLAKCYSQPHSLCLFRRSYSASAPLNDAQQNIAVLGGGITGLSSAFLLAQKLPAAKITLYESSSRLGGWLQSKEVEVDGESVIFEQGPRTLRPSGASGMAIIELIRLLELQDEVLITPRHAAAARNRYIYYPDRLVAMPGPGQTFWEILQRVLSDQIFRGVPTGVAMEPLRAQRTQFLEDESIGSFMRRRFSAPLADNLVSAVLHGIYAGDIDKLSVRALLPGMWYHELSGSVVLSVLSKVLEKKIVLKASDVEFSRRITGNFFDGIGIVKDGKEWARDLLKASVFTFKGGIETLSKALEARLELFNNVTIERNVSVKGAKLLRKEPEEKIQLTLEGSQGVSETKSFSEVLSTTSMQSFFSLLSDSAKQGQETPPPSVTVLCTNLYYSNPKVLPVSGFGYLLPRSIPLSQNPERALGVVFDSDAAGELDSSKGTKLTVMFGGHWWNGWGQNLPTEEDGLNMAKSLLKRHLGIDEEPVAWNSTLQRDCIPQYTVGHVQRMQKINKMLQREFDGRLRVAGANWFGVSVNDCVRSAIVTAENIAEGNSGTGLEMWESDNDIWTVETA